MKQRWTLQIDKGEVRIAPLMVFTGDNNAGKSYVMALLWGVIALGRDLLFQSDPPKVKAYGSRQMHIERLNPDDFCRGQQLHVCETTGEGSTDLLLELPEGSLLLQYQANIKFILKNQKRADGIVLFPDEKGVWGMLLVELKRSVNSANKWNEIKQQWHGAWLHGLAIAGILGIKLANRVEVMMVADINHNSYSNNKASHRSEVNYNAYFNSDKQL